jgi:hypothetical protein
MQAAIGVGCCSIMAGDKPTHGIVHGKLNSSRVLIDRDKAIKDHLHRTIFLFTTGGNILFQLPRKKIRHGSYSLLSLGMDTSI